MERKIYSTSKAQMFAQVITIVEGAENVPNKTEIVERLHHEIELIGKKKTSSNTANTELNNNVTAIITEVLKKAKKPLTVTEIQQQSNDRLTINAGINTSRVTANLTKMKDAGLVKRTAEKKKAYYSLVEKHNTVL